MRAVLGSSGPHLGHDRGVGTVREEDISRVPR